MSPESDKVIIVFRDFVDVRYKISHAQHISGITIRYTQNINIWKSNIWILKFQLSCFSIVVKERKNMTKNKRRKKF